jgi:probable F420-dependent oxidoreductase
VHIGLTIWFTPASIRPAELARAAEQRGFESLFVPEHSHIPVSRETPFPGGGDLPDEYRRMLDPFAALTAAATVTTDLVVGTSVCLVTQRDPILLAKETATLDLLSNGRFVFGVGAGWNVEELRDHGAAPARRWRVLRERVEAVVRIWEDDVAEYHGDHVDFGPMWSWPKPVQRPHPPVLVGGTGPHVIDRVLAYGDGWMPSPALFERPFAEQVAELQDRARAAGRTPLPVTMYGGRADPAALDALEEAGVSRAVLGLPPAPADVVLPLLDDYARVVTSR